jgi:hypothetical protein
MKENTKTHGASGNVGYEGISLRLLLLMSVFSKTFLSFMGRDLMSFSLFSARHDFDVL